MKKVIFLCLLSLTVCLSKPAENQAATTSPPAKAVDAKLNLTTEVAQPAQPTPVATETQPPANKEQAKAETDKISTPTVPSVLPPKETAASPTHETPKESPKPTEDNKTPKEQEQKETPKPKEESVPTTNSSSTKVTTEKPNTDKPEEAKAKDGTKTDGKDATTLKPTDAPAKTTEAPKSDKDAHIVQARGFDGPSFIGGIILTLGLLAIGFMGFKYYKNQTERNYHTL